MAEMIRRYYSGFTGVDLRGGECAPGRSPDAVNMWRDYSRQGGVTTRPGMEQLLPLQAEVWGIFFYKDMMLIHSGSCLYRVKDGQSVLIYSGLAERRSCAFVFGDRWYFKDGVCYLVYDGSLIEPVKGYVPTTTISREPTGGGVKHEDVNMLSDYRINSFLPDGVSFSFFLDTENIDSDFYPVVTLNGETVDRGKYTVDYTLGSVTFKSEPPEPPLSAGQDNLAVRFKKEVRKYKECILGTTIAALFDNRVFFSGYSGLCNTVWHTGLDDPTYVSDLDYYIEGSDGAAVRGLVAGNNALWVMREGSESGASVFYHTPVIDDSYGKIYPSSHSNISLGCSAAAVNFGDDIVFFSERGMEGISGDITTEQLLSHRSSLVDPLMLSEPLYRQMLLAEWRGYLCVMIGDSCYLADSRAVYKNENHYEYEWFYFKLEKSITAAAVKDGVLYLGTEDGVYSLTDESKRVTSRWTTPKDRCGLPNMYKSTAHRGCIAEISGSLRVYAITDSGHISPSGEFFGEGDFSLPRIRCRRFKDIQLRFESDSRFTLESATLLCCVGGYIKNKR